MREKIKYNMKSDQTTSRRMSSDGWSVLRFWEHDIIKNSEKPVLLIKNPYYDEMHSQLMKLNPKIKIIPFSLV